MAEIRRQLKNGDQGNTASSLRDSNCKRFRASYELFQLKCRKADENTFEVCLIGAGCDYLKAVGL